jgi:hypothetical protein
MDLASKPKAPRPEEKRAGLAWSERNFDGMPLFLPNTRTDKRRRIVVEDVVEGEGGMEVRSKWTVVGHGTLGLPGSFDEKVYVGTLALLEKQGGPDEQGRLWFKPYELFKAIGMKTTGGDNYGRLAESIERVSGAHIVSERAFYSARLGRRFSRRGFGLWKYKLSEHFGARGSNLEMSYVRYDDVFLENYEHGYMDRLDTAFYMALSRPLSRRLYRLLNEKCDGRGGWSVDAMLLKGLVPLSEGYASPSEVKKALTDAHRELERMGFLQGAEFVGTGRGKARVEYLLAPNFGRRRLLDVVVSDGEGREAVELLHSFHLSREEAAALVAEHGAETCIRNAEALPHQKNVRNPAGFLKRSLSEGWSLGPVPQSGDAPKKAAGTGGAGGDPKGDAGGSSSGSSGAGKAAPRYELDPTPDPAAQGVWDFVIDDMADSIDAPARKVWFEGTVPVSLEGEVLTVSVPNSFALEYITERFRDGIEKALKARLSHRASLRIVVDGSSNTSPGGPAEPQRRRPNPASAEEPSHGGERQAAGADDPGEIWRGLVDALLDDKPEVDASWLAPYLGHSLEGGELVVSAPDEDARSRIIERFGDVFDRLWKRRRGAGARIVVGLRAGSAGEGGDR